MSFVEDSAPLAQRFRSCSELLQELYDFLLEQPEPRVDEPGSQFCQEEIGRLKLWNESVRSSSGELDHDLRKNGELFKHVYNLLGQLEDAIKKANEENPMPTAVERASDGTMSSLGTSLGTSEDISIGSMLRPQSPMTASLYDIRAIIQELLRISPSLNQVSSMSSTPSVPLSAANTDIRRVEQLHPKADRALAVRLGNASWARRQELMNVQRLQEGSPNDPAPFEPVVQSKGRNVHQTITPVGSPSPTHDHTSYDAAQESATASSVSRFRRVEGNSTLPASSRVTQVESMTSVTQSTKGDNYYQHEIMQDQRNSARLRLPLPPPPNRDFNGAAFKCPYCLMLLVNVTDPRTWRRHVMTDLEPYVCTKLDCPRGSKTYGTRHRWFNHELDVHMRRKSWVCCICAKEFMQQSEIETHFRSDHAEDVPGAVIASLVKTCETVSNLALTNIECPLCRKICPDEKNYKTHVAYEMEQLSLFALPQGAQAGDNSLDLKEDFDFESDVEEIRDAVHSIRLSQELQNNLPLERFLAEGLDGNAGLIRPEHRPSDPNLPGAASQIIKEPEVPRQRNPSVQFPVSTVTKTRDEDFYGRTALLEQIHGYLQKDRGQTCVIHGLGGVGKTLLALEYTHVYASTYDAMLWFQADTEPGIIDSSFVVAEKLGMIDDTVEVSETVEIAREWMEKTDKRWLAIVDNAEQWDAVRRAMPPWILGTNGSVIITTQNSSMLRYSQANIALKPVDPHEGGRMILHYLRACPSDQTPEPELAREIADIIGGLPVSIGLVGSWIKDSRNPIGEAEDLLNMFRDSKAASTSVPDEPYTKSLDKAKLSYQETLAVVSDFFLRELGRDSRDLIYILAYLNSDAIPESMLSGMHDHPELQFLTPHRYRRALGALLRWRLIKVQRVENENCLTIHRELQRYLQDILAADSQWQGRVFDHAVSIVKREFPAPSPIQVPEEDKWPQYRRLLRHVSTLRNVYMSANSQIHGSMAFAELLSNAGINQWDQGTIKEGMQLLLAAEKVLVSDLNDTTSPLRANIHCVIGVMMNGTGITRRREGFDRCLKVLQMREAYTAGITNLSRDDEILLYNAQSDLAYSLLQYNDYTQAEPIWEKCLSKYQQWGSEEEVPYEYGKYYYSMANIRMYQGRYDESIEMEKQAMYWTGKHGPGNTSGVYRCKFNLACIKLQMGDIQGALDLHREVLRDRKFKSGMYNELTLESSYAVAVLYEMLGELAEAEILLREVLNRHKTADWCEEGVARTMYHLSSVLRRQEKDVEHADKLYAQAKAILDRLLPLDMPDWLQGETDEAILFDHLRADNSRFTGQGLLKRFQARYNPDMGHLAPTGVLDLVMRCGASTSNSY